MRVAYRTENGVFPALDDPPGVPRTTRVDRGPRLLERLGIPVSAMDRPAVCPAGRMIGETPEGPTCYCGVTDSLVGARTDPRALVGFCQDRYTQCPVWRAEKERIWSARREIGG